MKVCKGVCCNQEDIDEYNIRVDQAVSDLKVRRNECIVLDKGRNEDENAVVHLSPSCKCFFLSSPQARSLADTPRI